MQSWKVASVLACVVLVLGVLVFTTDDSKDDSIGRSSESNALDPRRSSPSPEANPAAAVAKAHRDGASKLPDPFSVVLGTEYSTSVPLIDHYSKLESEIAAGNAAKALDLAHLIKKCAPIGNDVFALEDPEHPAHLLAKQCDSLPPHDPRQVYELVELAAASGDREAIVEQVWFPPPGPQPDEAELDGWKARVMQRLNDLAQKGDPDAFLALYRAHASGSLSSRNIDEAKAYALKFLASAPRGDIRRQGVEQALEGNLQVMGD